MTELYKQYRPQKFSEIVGQDDAIRVLNDFGRRKAMPHTILLSGPSGCGKTTIARILRKKLHCSDVDFRELNCADFRGIDMVRDIRSRVSLAPIGGKCRIWLIDECARLTTDAQNAFLKILEDTPSHVYFFLATTEPQKLLKTIRTRATDIRVSLLRRTEMEKLLRTILEKEGTTISDEPIDRIIEVAEGSPRKGLVLLGSVIGLENEDEQLAAIRAGDVKGQAIMIARALIKPGVGWPEVANILREIDEEPESLRWMILSYCTTVLLSGGKLADRAYQIVDVFRDNFYDSKRAGLVAACWEVVCGE